MIGYMGGMISADAGGDAGRRDRAVFARTAAIKRRCRAGAANDRRRTFFTIGVPGGTKIFCSPSVVFSKSKLALHLFGGECFDLVDTLALVMVEPGWRSHGRCPSPVPRELSGKMCTSSA